MTGLEGLLFTSSTGAKIQFTPMARASCAVILPSTSAQCSDPVAPIAIFQGKDTVLRMRKLAPLSKSEAMRRGNFDKACILSKLPLLIASDFERGANFRIRSTVSFPWNMAIGATGSEHWAEVEGKITAQEARAMGVNWIFAPVLDVNNNPSNPVINIRSFGEDAELVARLGVAFVRGAQQAGVLATGKHFPGHGDTGVDSHLELPLVTADRQRLEKMEFVPFKKAIENGVWAIMTAHLAVPALESDPNIPATLSRKVLQVVLQQELEFSNLVVTDSLKMAGLANGFWIGDAVVRAVKAGVDVLLDPPNADVVYQAL